MTPLVKLQKKAMKRLLLSLIVCAVTMMHCTKEKSRDIICVDGQIMWGGDPAVDGVGWYLQQVENEEVKSYILTGIPPSFQVEGLAVKACIYDSGQPARCFCGKSFYKIESIDRR